MPGPQPDIRRAFRAMTRDPMRLEREAGLLVLLSVCDLLMTYVLLWQGEHFYEANPIAQWWFARWNVAGLTAFKFLLIGIVVAICESVERHRPNVGRAVLWLGIVAAGYAFLSGASLFYRHAMPG